MRFRKEILVLVLPLLAAAQEGGTARDRAAIDELHRKDSTAAKAGDVETLGTLWTADAVALPPGEAPVVGIDAIRTWLNRTRMDTTRFEITEYVLDFQEVRIEGERAFEWARTSMTMRPKGAPQGMRATGSLMRVLHRQPDGSWKVSRAIWNMGQPAPAPAH